MSLFSTCPKQSIFLGLMGALAGYMGFICTALAELKVRMCES